VVICGARSAVVDGQFTDEEVGALWSDGRMWVDAAPVGVAWGSLPTRAWFHLHVEAATVFTAHTVAVMASLSSTTAAGLSGRVAEAALWAAPLPGDVLRDVVNGFDGEVAYGLLAMYLMEEGTGVTLADLTGAWTL
jgi:hypothetical protein